jgi:hypothetical protein
MLDGRVVPVTRIDLWAAVLILAVLQWVVIRLHERWEVRAEAARVLIAQERHEELFRSVGEAKRLASALHGRYDQMERQIRSLDGRVALLELHGTQREN